MSLATHPDSKLKFFPPIAKQNSSIKSVKLGSPLSMFPEGGQGWSFNGSQTLAIGTWPLEWPQWALNKANPSINPKCVAIF